MLISFIALIYLVDGIFGGVHNLLVAHGVAWFPSSAEQILGWLFSPVAWVIGVPWHDCPTIANLLGLRLVTNELVAFQRLGPMENTLDPRTYTIATFALCGFANFSSIGIQIGGIGALAPNKRTELAQLGLRALMAGTMANLMSASTSSGSCCTMSAVRAGPPQLTQRATSASPAARRNIHPFKIAIAPENRGRARFRLRRLCRRVDRRHPHCLRQNPRLSQTHGRRTITLTAWGSGIGVKVPVAGMQGRVHFYEGYSMKEVVYPMRVLRQMGIQAAILTNAAGASISPSSPGIRSSCAITSACTASTR